MIGLLLKVPRARAVLTPLAERYDCKNRLTHGRQFWKHEF